MNGVTCKLFGTVIRYLMILRDNYAGQWINFSTIDEYRQRRQEPQKWQEMKKRQADAKVRLLLLLVTLFLYKILKREKKKAYTHISYKLNNL